MGLFSEDGANREADRHDAEYHPEAGEQRG
jgi:hypothetical protein